MTDTVGAGKHYSALEMANALSHANILAARRDYRAAQMYLDLAEAYLDDDQAMINTTINRVIDWEIRANSMFS